MRLWLFSSLALAVASCATAPAPPSLVGAWRLERYVDTPAAGPPVMAFGERPIGYFIFTEDGHASISFMRNPPTPSAADPDPDACQPDWYCSYFGTYDVDWSGPAWTVHVEGGNIPSFIGTDQTRAFTLSVNRLVIAGSDEDADGANVRTERVLVRAR